MKISTFLKIIELVSDWAKVLKVLGTTTTTLLELCYGDKVGDLLQTIGEAIKAFLVQKPRRVGFMVGR